MASMSIVLIRAPAICVALLKNCLSCPGANDIRSVRHPSPACYKLAGFSKINSAEAALYVQKKINVYKIFLFLQSVASMLTPMDSVCIADPARHACCCCK
jgi:hypothetical protein